MAKSTPDATLDAYCIKVATATRQTVCAGQPTSYADIAARLLASIALTAGHGNGDHSVGDGAVSGRANTVAAQSAVPITASGTGDHVVLDDGTAIIEITTVTPQALTSGGTVDIGAWTQAIADPT